MFARVLHARLESMPRPRPALAALALGTLLLAGACADDAVSPTASDAQPGAPSLSVAASLAQEPVPDQLAVAQAVPGFGGYFIDEQGAPTVYLTDPTRRAEAEVALAGFLASFGWTAADLRVRQADYDYLQLHAWYEQAWPQALAVAGAVLSDIDEARNRLRFAGADASALTSIADVLAGVGAPSAATVLELTGPVEQTASLRDQIRPGHGGLQVQFFASPASPLVYLCTIGFNAVKPDGVASFITNSHCSNVQGGITVRTDYYQATRGGLVPNPNNFLAFEVDDPEYFTGGACPVARRCRYSDAARAEYGAGQMFVLGKVARTAVLNTTLAEADTARLRIDDVAPTYSIAAEQPAPVMGQMLNKVGRTTGWTSGVVDATCVNVNITASEITQLCQSLVDAYVAGGDSGSPVFGLHTDGTAFLAGILWGSSTNRTTGKVRFIFSPLDQVETELGQLTVVDPTLDTGGKKQKKAK